MKTGLSLLLASAFQVRAGVSAADLEAQLAADITNKAFQAPTRAEFIQAQALFAQTLGFSRSLSELQADWKALGFSLTEVELNNRHCWLLRDLPGHARGGGWYLFRQNGTNTALEAPHAKNDLYTGVIALQLFIQNDARLLACSTSQRKVADMAHLEGTFFHALTLAFADVCRTGLVVQLHGFENLNHTGLSCDAIVSPGKRASETWVKDVAAHLAGAGSLKVLQYPQDAKASGLGGTSNAQARAINRVPGCRFLHLEMSLELRERLRGQARLGNVLLEGLRIASVR